MGRDFPHRIVGTDSSANSKSTGLLKVRGGKEDKEITGYWVRYRFGEKLNPTGSWG